jgi:hypothetical protein
LIVSRTGEEKIMSCHRSVLFSLIIAAGAIGCHRDRDVAQPTLPPAESPGNPGNSASPTPGGSTDPNYQPAPTAPDQNSQNGTATGAGPATPGASPSDNGTSAYPNNATSSAPGAGTTSNGYGTPPGPATPTNAEDRERGTPMSNDNVSGGYTSGGSTTSGGVNDPSSSAMATDAGVPDDGGTSDAGTKRKKTGGGAKGSGGGSGSGSGSGSSQ